MAERERETVERAAILKDGVVYDVPRPGRHCDVMRKLVVELVRRVFTSEDLW